MTNDDSPRYDVYGCSEPGFLPGMRQTVHSITIYGGDFRTGHMQNGAPRRSCIDPTKPLTGLALRLLAVSNAWRHG